MTDDMLPWKRRWKDKTFVIPNEMVSGTLDNGEGIARRKGFLPRIRKDERFS